MMSQSNIGSSSFGNLNLASCKTEGVLFEILSEFNIPAGRILLRQLSTFAII